MEKLSELKKVELLEETVLKGDIEGVKAILAEQAPIEFTARAIGLACRFIGAEMVETLLDGGAVLQYEFTPNIKRKYDCKITISNNWYQKIEFSRFLFPDYQVKAFTLPIVSDDERQKILRTLYAKNACDMSELLYYAILYHDSALLEVLDELGVNKLSNYRTDIATGRIQYNRLDSFGRYDKSKFQEAIQAANSRSLLDMLTRYLSCTGVEQIALMPTDYYDMHKKFISRYCSTVLFDFFIHKTNMLRQVKKWDMINALVEQNNAAGMQYAMNEKWITKPGDIKILLGKIQKKRKIDPSLVACVLDVQNCITEKKPAKKNSFSDLSLGNKSLSLAELKKIWGFKKLEDGSLILTSYKGDAVDVVIPSAVGNATITAIASEAFNAEASRVTKQQKEARLEICSVDIPGTIKEIPTNLFAKEYGDTEPIKLKRIILHEGTEKIADSAFQRCIGLEEIIIPETVTYIGKEAFSSCRSLKELKLPEAVTELSESLFFKAGLEKFELGPNIEKMEAGVFAGCANLAYIKLPDTLKAVPNGTFWGCKSLKKVELPKSVTEIDAFAFAESGLSEIDLPECVTYIGEGAFQNCENLKKAVVPKEASFGDYPFSGCIELIDQSGRIIINGALVGLRDSNLSATGLLTPLEIPENTAQIAITPERLPAIVYRTHQESGTKLNVSGLSKGDEVFFGRFPEMTDYIVRPLRWRVLAKNEGKALLITSKCIICHKSELSQKGIWEKAPVRRLLNGGFYRTAFTSSEKKQIAPTINRNPKNKGYKVDGGPDTKDHVFLLSTEDLDQYLPMEEWRIVSVTEYAYSQYGGKKEDSGCWQLRTPGKASSVGVYLKDGHINSYGSHTGPYYIRPCIWVKNG